MFRRSYLMLLRIICCKFATSKIQSHFAERMNRALCSNGRQKCLATFKGVIGNLLQICRFLFIRSQKKYHYKKSKQKQRIFHCFHKSQQGRGWSTFRFHQYRTSNGNFSEEEQKFCLELCLYNEIERLKPE